MAAEPTASLLEIRGLSKTFPGVKGLQLAGAQTYVNDLFNGFALIIAVALSARTPRATRKT